jgi:TolB protein
MNMLRWMFCLLLIAALNASADAQVSVHVNFTKKSIAIGTFTGDAKVLAVIKNDLTLSGAFEVKPASEDAEYILQGNAAPDRVECTVVQAASKNVVMSKAFTGGNSRAVAHQAADEIVLSVTGKRGIAQTKIAFIYSRKAGVKELAQMDYDGYNIQLLSQDGKISGHPRWSPDGRKIIYTSYWKGYPDVLEADLVAHTRRIIAGFPGMNTGANYSPDGSKIALILSRQGSPHLYMVNPDGSGLRRVTDVSNAVESSPTWSPDGESIAYVSNASGTPQIWQVDRNGGESRRLTVSPSYNTEPDWSHPPSGSDLKSMIAVTSQVGHRFQVGIYDGDRAVVARVDDNADNADPTWAPDGRHIVFSKTKNYRSQLYLLDVLTNEAIQLTAVEGEASEPAWGPWR